MKWREMGMTEKQKVCIKWICEVLGMKYYGRNTKSDAFKFISKYIDRAKEVSWEASFYNSWGLSFLLNCPF